MSPIAGVRSGSRGASTRSKPGASGRTAAIGRVRTGWPPLKAASGAPSRPSTRSSPLESASTTSSRLSPSTSHSRCEASPPVPRRRSQPSISVLSR